MKAIESRKMLAAQRITNARVRHEMIKKWILPRHRNYKPSLYREAAGTAASEFGFLTQDPCVIDESYQTMRSCAGCITANGLGKRTLWNTGSGSVCEDNRPSL